MLYFSGFSLQDEKSLFAPYTIDNDLVVTGFSYGAQKAFEYVYNSKKHTNRLILLSPAFFQTQKSSFVRTQLRYFKAGKEEYVKQFLQNVTYPSSVDLNEYLNVGTQDELEELLNYKWDSKKIEELLNRGTTIEVFLGAKDKILNAQEAFDFFSSVCTSYLLKDAGHLLRCSN
jgi:hypothetical protein